MSGGGALRYAGERATEVGASDDEFVADIVKGCRIGLNEQGTGGAKYQVAPREGAETRIAIGLVPLERVV